MIKLTIEDAAKARGINTQRELTAHIKKTLGVEMRQATISDMYRNNKTAINRVHLLTVMRALDITDFNEVLRIE